MRVAVVGGGIQGCATALELASRGVGVELFERRPRLFDGASRHSEGKIHLGYVYAADDTLRTARLMARGAAAFSTALERWAGADAARVMTSRPFAYAVHRDSMRPVDVLAATYARITQIVTEDVPPGAYFGTAAPATVRRLERGELGAYGPGVAAVFQTAELAVDTDALADVLVGAVTASERIAATCGAEVVRGDRRRGRITVADAEGTRELGPFDHVINCSWDGRVALDATVGIQPPAPWCFRMKYFGSAKVPDDWPALPSTTIVLGPFGDVVEVAGRVYLSWYPTGRRGWSEDVTPPPWPTTLAADEAQSLLAGFAAGLGDVVPAAGRLLAEHADRIAVRGGVIYALGDTDVEDADSILHERHAVGPLSWGSYHSVDTGKMTVAPLFAMQLVDRICDA